MVAPGPTSAVFIPLLSVHEVAARHSSTKGPLSPVEAFHKISLKRHEGSRLGTVVGVVGTPPYPKIHPHIPSSVAHHMQLRSILLWQFVISEDP